jgi:hypothetical protein
VHEFLHSARQGAIGHRLVGQDFLVPEETFPSPTLSNDGVMLRPPTEVDVDAVAEFGADALVQTCLALPSPYTVEVARWFCTQFGTQQQESGRGLVLGIEVENRLAGGISPTDPRLRYRPVGQGVPPKVHASSAWAQERPRLAQNSIRNLGWNGSRVTETPAMRSVR